MSTYAPFAKPLYVMLKPVGAVCNLACDYCYYLEKSKLYVNNPKHVMSDELLEKFIEEYINSQTMPQVLFTWHGGETLMRPLAFYKKAMELQKKYANGRTIDNCIQTNGTLLTDEWCEFFKENNWLVGVSIDGPQEFHDEYRKNKLGKPSFVKVMQGINLLKKHGVEWNAMAVVNDFNADYPLEFYNFFKEIGSHYIQFAPIVERITPHQDGRHLASLADKEKSTELADFSVSPEQWGDFLCALFDEWVKQDVGTCFNVYSYEENDFVETSLIEGSVRLYDSKSPSESFILKPSQKAIYSKNNGKISFHNTDNVKETAWTQNHLVFESEKLGSVFQKIERWYGVHIDLLCPEIANDQISGSFKDEQLPYVMEALKFQYGFNYEITGNNVTINKSNQLKIK